MKEYKKAWFFIKPYKFNLLLIIIYLILYQLTAFITPFIIQEIIDHQLLGIQDPWVIVANDDKNTIEYNNQFFKFADQVDDDDVVLKNASIALVDDNFYLIEDQIPNGNREIKDSMIIIDQQQYPATIIDDDDLILFYDSLIPRLILLVILLFVFSGLGILFTYLQNMTSALLTIKTTRDARKATIKKIQEIPMEIVESEPAGKTANRLLNDTIGISTLYTTTISIIFNMGVSLILAYIGMFILDPKIAFYTLIIIPIMVLWVLFYTRYLNKIVGKIAETDSLMIAKINEIINGIGILKVFNTQKKTIDDFSEINNTYIDQYMQEQKMHISFGWNGINLFQGLVSGFIIVIFGYYYLNGSGIEPGMINTYYTFVIRIIAPIGILFNQVSALENSKVKINRIYKILETESENQLFEDIAPFRGNIKFENVAFAYDDKNYVLHDINLHFKAGEKIGLVGHTGSGKSTLMNLLLRFNDLKEGMIKMDDIDINDYTKRTYRKHVGIILQEPILFTGTIFDNIKFGSDISYQKAQELLISVGGEKLITKYELGINEPISRKGGNLSLGEKQLISFARILASNPSVIVLDEATANIDTETEQLFSNALNVVAQGRTLIVIAHRLSTIVDANQIIVLQKGRIIETGNHNTLLKDNGYYANMYRTQIS